MAGTVARAMPSGEVIKQMLPGSGATGTLLGPAQYVRIAFNATSTANASMAWINPENGTVMARHFMCWTTAGTGTIIVGVSSDGTGSNNNILTAGTMLAGVVTRATTASALLGTAGENGGYFLIGPGGTGTNNSIVAAMNDGGATSTAAGFMLIQYIKTQP